MPGLYRFMFEGPESAQRVYIGETDDLRRRAQHYRTPGVTQRTNLRMNNELVDAIRRGWRVSCGIVTAASVSLDEAASAGLDLSRMTSRLIVENAAMASVITEREADPVRGPVLVNRPGVGESEWA